MPQESCPDRFGRQENHTGQNHKQDWKSDAKSHGTSNLMSVKAVEEQKQSKRASQSRFAFAAFDQANHLL